MRRQAAASENKERNIFYFFIFLLFAEILQTTDDTQTRKFETLNTVIATDVITLELRETDNSNKL